MTDIFNFMTVGKCIQEAAYVRSRGLFIDAYAQTTITTVEVDSGILGSVIDAVCGLIR